MSRATPLAGPAFSSYSRDDVQWLLTDISSERLETTVEQREVAMQGGGHYSESLPIEYAPGAEYLEAYERALARSSRAVAVAVATLGEQLLAARGAGLTLVSLARAGTPAGILLRRWFARAQGVDAAHYTMSIILDRGLDARALDYLRDRHDPRSVVFVDGWTGKGSIGAELRRSVGALPAARGFSPDLAVIADPASTARYAGTRDDVLIPSACLNATVSGLVSRTAYSPAFISDGAFHGAKFYSELAEHDRSAGFIAAVSAWFDDVWPHELAAPAPVPGARERVALELERLMATHGVGRASLVKPGVCEATRVLLRRAPRLLVVRELGMPQLEHLEILAAARGTAIVVDPLSLYSAVGIIAPAAAP